MVSRRRIELDLIPSRDPVRADAAEVRIHPKVAEASAALTAAGGEFTAAIISGTALAAAAVWAPSLTPCGTDPQAFDLPPPPLFPLGTGNLDWSGV